MRRLIGLAWLGAALAVGVAGCGEAEIDDADQAERLETIRRATAVYQDVDAALRAGYRPAPQCVEAEDESGALGEVYTNTRLQQDQQVDLLRPELLFYEPQEGAAPPALVGVGYRVPDEDQAPPETPLGHMEGPIPAAGRGQMDRFELHAWVHRENPDGPLATWNPDVECL